VASSGEESSESRAGKVVAVCEEASAIETEEEGGGGEGRGREETHDLFVAHAAGCRVSRARRQRVPADLLLEVGARASGSSSSSSPRARAGPKAAAVPPPPRSRSTHSSTADPLHLDHGLRPRPPCRPLCPARPRPPWPRRGRVRQLPSPPLARPPPRGTLALACPPPAPSPAPPIHPATRRDARPSSATRPSRPPSLHLISALALPPSASCAPQPTSTDPPLDPACRPSSSRRTSFRSTSPPSRATSVCESPARSSLLSLSCRPPRLTPTPAPAHSLANHVPSIESLKPGVLEVIEGSANESKKWFGPSPSPSSVRTLSVRPLTRRTLLQSRVASPTFTLCVLSVSSALGASPTGGGSRPLRSAGCAHFSKADTPRTLCRTTP